MINVTARTSPRGATEDRGGISRFVKALRIGVCAAAVLAFVGGRAHAETIGLVMTSWHVEGVFTKDGKSECPDGLNPTLEENFKAQFKTKEEQDAIIKKYGSTQWHYRGPNGESDNNSPETVFDPLPHPEPHATASDGFNLDGTQDGRATDKTCKHDKFVNASGEAVDNQFYRVTGCVKSFRPQGTFDGFITNEIPALMVNRWLIEIKGVDDRMNDDHVDVMIAHGLDELVADGNNGFVAGRSQRVDEGSASFIQHTTGRIVNGVFMTDSMPEFRMTGSGLVEVGERRFKDARFKLKLTPNGATGVLAGYGDIPRLWRFYAKTIGLHAIASTVSPPSLYHSIVRNADGYKDPATGQCTAISQVYAVGFVNANIVRQSSSTDVAAAISKGAGAVR